MTRIFSILAQVLVATVVGLAIAYCIVWGIDDDEAKVRSGAKDPRTAILPVIDHATQR